MTTDSFRKLKIPNNPGVYFFLGPSKIRSEGDLDRKKILYIGKAASLRDRVRSYFNNRVSEARGPLIEKMVAEATRVKWQETDSVLEALILEAELIKKHQPTYNTKEKSDKSFLYVVITKEDLPRVITARAKDIKGYSTILTNFRIDMRYGPFTDGGQLREALKILRRIFPFLDDKSKNHLEFYKQVGLVPDLDDRATYLRNIRNIKLFFAGKKKNILKSLMADMKSYAKAREFEKAGEIKRQIFALKHINDIALIKQNRSSAGAEEFSGAQNEANGRGRKFLRSGFRIESYDIAHMSGKNMVGVMAVVKDGEIEKNEYRKFKIRTQLDANDTGALSEVLERRFSHPEWPFPDLVVVDGGMAQLRSARGVVAKLHLDSNIPVVSVVKDERHKPESFLGDREAVKRYKEEILLANSEAHRFAIGYHKKLRAKSFLAIV